MSDDQKLEYIVSLSAICKNPNELTKAAEVLARSGTGLAMDGFSVSMSISGLHPSPEEVGDQQ